MRRAPLPDALLDPPFWPKVAAPTSADALPLRRDKSHGGHGRVVVLHRQQIADRLPDVLDRRRDENFVAKGAHRRPPPTKACASLANSTHRGLAFATATHSFMSLP